MQAGEDVLRPDSFRDVVPIQISLEFRMDTRENQNDSAGGQIPIEFTHNTCRGIIHIGHGFGIDDHPTQLGMAGSSKAGKESQLQETREQQKHGRLVQN
jgi:hypothetical protein